MCCFPSSPVLLSSCPPRNTLAISFCCKDIDSISFYFCIYSPHDFILLYFCAKITIIFHISKFFFEKSAILLLLFVFCHYSLSESLSLRRASNVKENESLPEKTILSQKTPELLGSSGFFMYLCKRKGFIIINNESHVR